MPPKFPQGSRNPTPAPTGSHSRSVSVDMADPTGAVESTKVFLEGAGLTPNEMASSAAYILQQMQSLVKSDPTAKVELTSEQLSSIISSLTLAQPTTITTILHDTPSQVSTSMAAAAAITGKLHNAGMGSAQAIGTARRWRTSRFLSGIGVTELIIAMTSRSSAMRSGVTRYARPKSAKARCPLGETRMFSGLMSRCIKPMSCSSVTALIWDKVSIRLSPAMNTTAHSPARQRIARTLA